MSYAAVWCEHINITGLPAAIDDLREVLEVVDDLTDWISMNTDSMLGHSQSAFFMKAYNFNDNNY